jgi:asparagine synthase (glutamine-hydrolysing)
MANSLETRIPFLDHNVVEFAWSLPFDYKINRGVGKWSLRSIIYKYVSKEMIERPKAGFAVPIDQWIRRPLKDWAESYLNASKLAKQGFLNVDIVRSLWQENILRKNNQQVLWNILMFQVWLENEK